MKLLLRMPAADDYVILASWIPDADASKKWAGQLIPFPFPKNLKELLEVDGARSYSLQGGDGAFLGFGQFWPRGEGWIHFGRIIVSPQHRGRGLGKALMTFLISEAIKEHSPDRMTLRVFRDNVQAIALYQAAGFHQVDQESTDDLLFMEREGRPVAEAGKSSIGLGWGEGDDSAASGLIPPSGLTDELEQPPHTTGK